MKVTLKTASPAEHRTPALIVFLFSEDKPGLADRPELAGLSDWISPRLKNKDFKASHLAVRTLFPSGDAGPERVILVGLGAAKDFTPARLRSAAAKGVRTAQDFKASSAALVLPPAKAPLGLPEQIMETAVLGARLGSYKFLELKTKEAKKFKPLGALQIIPGQDLSSGAARSAAQAAKVVAEAVCLARDLINRPANLVYPEIMAQEARKNWPRPTGWTSRSSARTRPKRKAWVHSWAWPGASPGPGQMIILKYQGGGAKKKPIALVGQGHHL